MKTKILLLLNLLLISTLSFGATYTVTNANASGEGSFAQAFADAVTGDIINFNFDGTEFTFPNEVPMKSITIDGLNAYNDQKVIFKQTASTSFFSLASGITGTFKNLIFDGTGIAGNTAIKAAKGSTLTVENCEFTNINAQKNNGGAMRIQGTANIVNSVFDGNQTSGGYGGGSICIYGDTDVMIDKCTFVNNSSLSTAKSGGGAVVVRGRDAAGIPTKLTVSNSTFANNNSSNFGSAILCSVQSKTANYIVNVDIINCTITGNATVTASGAVETHADSLGTLNLNLVNTIVTHNVNSSGYSDVLENKESGATATLTTELYNTIYGVSSVTPDAGRNCIEIADPAVANIFFKSLETFATDKKRPVLTSASGQKIAAISETSIARGAGIATLAGFDIPTKDQTGGARPATPSIGAVEYYVWVGVSDDAVNTELKMITKDKVISFTGLSGVSPVAVYGLTGNLLHQSLVGNNQEISLDHLSDNLVIVRINNKSFKAFLK